jgi:DNA-binding IscR family transcriptional regulator
VQLTRYADYSLPVLIYLAVDSERLVTIEEIARVYDISKAHLMKVVLAVLDRYTLADLVDRRRRSLGQLLQAS